MIKKILAIVASLSSFQKICLGLILLAVVFFSFFRVTESPPYSFDEGWAVHIAANISQIGIDGTQFSPGEIGHVSTISVGYPLIYALAFWFKLFGVGVLQARVMMVIYMLGFVAVSFVLLRRLYGNTTAISALAILAVFPPFYSFGKNMIGEVPVLFFLALFLLFLNLATSDGRKKTFWLILSGAAAGLCVATKSMAIVLIPALFVGAFLAFRKGSVTWKDIGVFAISAIIPIGVWLIVNFQPGDSLSSIASYYSNPSALTDHTATFWQNLQAFFVGLGPLFMISFLAVWVIGVGIRLKARTKIPVEESVALVFTVLQVLSLLFRYWDARYLFPIQVLVILFAPYSLYRILLALPIKLDNARKDMVYASCIVILCVLGLYQLLFRSYIADTYSGNYTETVSKYFSSIPDSKSIFFYNTPTLVTLFHGRDYYQRIAVFEKWVSGAEYAPLVAAGRVDMLILNPPMTKADMAVPLDGYVKVAEFGKTMVYERKNN